MRQRCRKNTYGNDVDTVLLTSEIGILKTILKGDKPRNAAEVVAILNECDHEIRLIPRVMKIAKSLLVNGATSASPERSFSTPRRLKTLLRSTMSKKRSTALALLTTHKDLTDNICFVNVGNTFVASQTGRYNHFGKFVDEDISL